MLKELGCGDKPTLLVLNKVDRVADPSLLQVLQTPSPACRGRQRGERQGLDELQDAVDRDARAPTSPTRPSRPDAGNGKVLAYLAAHAEIYRQEFHDNRVSIRCYLPRHLLHHIQGPDVQVRFLADGER